MVFGAVDRSHIPIMQPYLNSQDYYCYKMKYTIHVKGVCVTSVADSSMLTYDGQVEHMMQKYFHTVQSTSFLKRKTSQFYAGHHYLAETRLQKLKQLRDKVSLILLRDPAYPLLPHVMKEFATCSADAQVVFNQMLRDARNAIECGYGIPTTISASVLLIPGRTSNNY